MMHAPCEIRSAREQDAVAISALILDLAHVVTGSTSPECCADLSALGFRRHGAAR